MTAGSVQTLPSRLGVEPPRSRRRLVVALPVALGVAFAVLAAGAPSVRADQTVFFDDAGDSPHISLIGDSTLTGVRWYADYGALERFNFVFSAESCRRTFEQSCISQEGYRSENVLAAMRTLDGELGEVVVVMSGYNDPGDSIADAIDGVVAEARDQGVGNVVWMSLRTSDGVNYSDPQDQSSINTFRDYNEQLFEAAEASDGYLQIADWAAHSNGASGWFETDGVHLTARGVDAVTTYIAGTVGRVLAGENVNPGAAPWTVLVPGAEGDAVEAVQEALIAADVEVNGGADGVFGNDTMAAVAAYQRRTEGLQVTGAVDMATARSLGVLADPDGVTATTTTMAAPAPTTQAVREAIPVNGADVGAAPERAESGGGALSQGLVVTALALAALVAVVSGRRRYVVAQRASRSRARVHPSTSPRRSVADMRRTGELPAIGPIGARRAIYDHELEEPATGGRRGRG